MLFLTSLQSRLKKILNSRTTHPQEVPVHVVVQPVMDHYVPSAIVIGKRG